MLGNILNVEAIVFTSMIYFGKAVYEMKNHKVTVPRVGFLRKSLLSFSSSARKIKKRTALQIGRWTGTDCVREAHCGAVPCRAERNARRPERRDDLISCVFLSSYTLIWSFRRTRTRMPAVTFLRNARNRSPRRYLKRSHSSRRISTLAPPKGWRHG